MKRQCRQLLEEAAMEEEEDDSITDNATSMIFKFHKRNPPPPPPPPPRGQDIEQEEEDKENNHNNHDNHHHHQVPSSLRKSNDCFRGLEGMTLDGKIKKRMLKENARQVVFQEQQRQASLGFHDPEAIAYEYFKAAEMARLASYRLATRDEKEALLVLAEELSKRSCMIPIPTLD